MAQAFEHCSTQDFSNEMGRRGTHSAMFQHLAFVEDGGSVEDPI